MDFWTTILFVNIFKLTWSYLSSNTISFWYFWYLSGMFRSSSSEIWVFLDIDSKQSSICSHSYLYLGFNIWIYVFMHFIAERERALYLSIIKFSKNDIIFEYLLLTLQFKATFNVFCEICRVSKVYYSVFINRHSISWSTWSLNKRNCPWTLVLSNLKKISKISSWQL